MRSDWHSHRFEFAEFEWDEIKAENNRRKHKIDFEDAKFIFRGLIAACTHIEDGEDRWIAIGQAAGRELVVVFAERQGRCRLISARKATREERGTYYTLFGG